MKTTKNTRVSTHSVALRSWIVFGISGTFALGLLGLGFAGEELLVDYYTSSSDEYVLTDSSSDEFSSDDEYAIEESPQQPEEDTSSHTNTATSDNTGNDDSQGGEPTVEDVVLTDAKYTGSDYLYYPVSKKYAFPSGFTPSGLVSLSGYDIPRVGGAKFYLRSSVAVALEDMLAEMEAEGYSMAVRSAYRSEGTQARTFNSWVQKERNKGYSYDEAVARASQYSARPRHSEHQLGTTIDLTLPRLDNAFTQSMWSTDEVSWLKANSYRYGFVFSYPKDRQAITGYSAEPWHLRWIGVNAATALYNQGYLNSGSSLSSTNYLFNH